MHKLRELGKFCLVGGILGPLASGILAGLLFSVGTFHIQFPVAEQSTRSVDGELQTGKPSPSRSGHPAEEAEGSVCKGKILVAKDHDINQILITEMIKRLDYRTVLAVNGEIAVEKVDAAARENAPFDLVLMDVQMPVMDGYAATESIRRNGYSKEELPILAITANAYPEDIEHCLQSAMQGHIPKPVMIGTLQPSLKEWVASDRYRHPETLRAGTVL